VVDRDDHLRGALPLNRLVVSDPEVAVATLIDPDIASFSPDGDAEEAAKAFERYELVSAPVVSADGRVIARLTVDAVLDFVRERQETQELAKVGLREEEDLFSSVWLSAKNRGPWLALNLCTAFVASRVVGAFEGSIEKLAALAAAHAEWESEMVEPLWATTRPWRLFQMSPSRVETPISPAMIPYSIPPRYARGGVVANCARVCYVTLRGWVVGPIVRIVCGNRGKGDWSGRMGTCTFPLGLITRCAHCSNWPRHSARARGRCSRAMPSPKPTTSRPSSSLAC
jgi:CBS domain-containing protein